MNTIVMTNLTLWYIFFRWSILNTFCSSSFIITDVIPIYHFIISDYKVMLRSTALGWHSG